VGHVVHSSAFREQNISTLFFMLVWDQYGFDKKCVRTPYNELMFLHLIVFAGHIVHSGASVARNVDTLYLMLEWNWCGFHKKRDRMSYVDLVFLHPVGLWVT
jgi:hypothetical protein